MKRLLLGVRRSWRRRNAHPPDGSHNLDRPACCVGALREPMRILITDGNERAALAAARSLVRAGHSVGVTADSRLSLAGVSRGIRPHPLTTDPMTQPAGYAAELAGITRRHGTTVLLPMTDAS